jgi:hypothetical protein
MLCGQNTKKGISAKKCFCPRPLSRREAAVEVFEAAVEV